MLIANVTENQLCLVEPPLGLIEARFGLHLRFGLHGFVHLQQIRAGETLIDECVAALIALTIGMRSYCLGKSAIMIDRQLLLADRLIEFANIKIGTNITNLMLLEPCDVIQCLVELPECCVDLYSELTRPIFQLRAFSS